MTTFSQPAWGSTIWECPGEGSNLHLIAETWPSTMRVCQFRHPGKGASRDIRRSPPEDSIGYRCPAKTSSRDRRAATRKSPPWPGAPDQTSKAKPSAEGQFRSMRSAFMRGKSNTARGRCCVDEHRRKRVPEYRARIGCGANRLYRGAVSPPKPGGVEHDASARPPARHRPRSGSVR